MALDSIGPCTEYLQFNALWLNPENPSSFPDGLVDALTSRTTFIMPVATRDRGTIEGRLRHQMRADALRPLDDSPDDPKKSMVLREWSTEILQESAQFLRLQVQCSLFSDHPNRCSHQTLLRHKIDLNWFSRTLGTGTIIVSGVERNMTTRRSWGTSVLVRWRMITIEDCGLGGSSLLANCTDFVSSQDCRDGI